MSPVGRVITWTWVGLFPLAAVVWWRSRWWYAAAILVFAIWVTRPIDDWQANVIRAKILGDSVLFDEAYAMGLVAIAVAASDRWITPPADWRTELRTVRASAEAAQKGLKP